MQQNNDLENLVEDIIKFGDCLLVSRKGTGKTNNLMVLAREFRELPDTRVFIFEDFPKWMKEFDKVGYFIIHDEDVLETSHTIDMEDYFLRHSRDYTILRGRELIDALKNNKDLIFVSEIQDIERQAFFIYAIVYYFYRKAYLRAYKDYHKTERIIFIIEESQNVFDASTISKKIFNRLRKIYSVARNLDLHFVFASQRLQDLNTKIRARAELLCGPPCLDDFDLKFYRLLRNSQYRHEILHFEIGEFLWTTKDKIVRFPRFDSRGKPFEIQQKTEEKLGFFQRILEKIKKIFRK